VLENQQMTSPSWTPSSATLSHAAAQAPLGPPGHAAAHARELILRGAKPLRQKQQ